LRPSWINAWLADKLGGKRRQAVASFVCPAIFDDDVPANFVATFLQAGPHELGQRCKRPPGACCVEIRPAEWPPARSTVSRRSCTADGGISMPSALAAFRLISWCLHRKVGRLLTLENAIDEPCRAPVPVDERRSCQKWEMSSFARRASLRECRRRRRQLTDHCFGWPADVGAAGGGVCAWGAFSWG
jgi:hypothetical protein